MRWLWILGILAALLWLLCRTRVGVRADFGGVLTLDVKVGIFHFRVLPGREKKKERREEERPPAEKKAKRTFPKPSFPEIRDAARTLWPPLRRALARTRRGIRIRPLELCVTLGGAGDPAEAAVRYGQLNAAVWAAMPALEQVLDIREPYLHIGVDYDAWETAARGRAGLSIRIGTLLAVGFGVAIPALRWFLAYRKRQKTAERPAEAAA